MRSGERPVYRYKGTNIENAVRQPDGRNGMVVPGFDPYILGGMWYDAAGKKLYAPLHCELAGGRWSYNGQRRARSTWPPVPIRA